MTSTSSSSAQTTDEQEALRRHGRAKLQITCEVRQATRPWQLTVLDDLSPTGFCISGLTHPSPGMPLSIRIPGLHPLTAQIRWNSGKLSGCEFTQPLHVAIFEHIAKGAR